MGSICYEKRHSERKLERSDFTITEFNYLKNIDELYSLEKSNFEKKEAFTKERLRELYNLSGNTFLVLKEGSHIIGYISANIDENNGRNVGVVSSVLIDSHFRGRGLSKYLFEEVFKRLKESMVKIVELQVKVSNEIAIKAYEKLGFKKIKLLKNYYHITKEDGYLMSKILDEGQESEKKTQTLEASSTDSVPPKF